MCSIVAVCQVDIKSLIAYSSVVHIGLVISRRLLSLSFSAQGALIIIIAHGVCRSGLFYVATLMYERVNSRRLVVIKGMIKTIPCIALLWGIILIINLRAPPSINLVSEVTIIIAAGRVS